MKNVSEEFEFFVFLLMQYAAHKNIPADRVLAAWDKAGLTPLINGMYWQYHTEALENAFADIDRLFAERQIPLPA